MSLIKVTNLSFAYEGSSDPVFENVSFQIDTDWKLGFIGRNGRGKTTFLNLLLGRYAYSGSISACVTFEMFPYPVRDAGRATRAVLHAIAPDCADWEFERELQLLNVALPVLDQPYETLSKGEQTKLMLAAMFLKQNGFLLIDEPTNHLDEATRETLCAYLNRKHGFILVSHDRRFLDGCIDHVLAINRRSIEVQHGNFSVWWENKARADSFEAAREERLRQDIKRLEHSARQKSDWSERVEKSKKGVRSAGLKPDKGYVGHKAAKMMKRAGTIEARRQSMIEEKRGLLQNVETQDALTLTPLTCRENRVCAATDVSVSYDGRVVCSGVRFEVCAGERVALRGRNGCGKSSILKLILGEEIDHTGAISLGSGVKISYVSQSTDGLNGSLSAYAARCGVDYTRLLTILRKLDFSRAQFEKDISDFSGGQKKKLLLARSFCEPAQLYLWDEPLNFIDVISRMQIEALILESRPTLLFVEHDRAFCENVATKQYTIGV